MNFDDLLKAELEQDIVINKSSETPIRMKPMQAMVKALLNNAMKGDISAIAFIRTLSKNVDPQEEKAALCAHSERLKAKELQLRQQLQNEGYYDGQDTELQMIAELAILVEDLDKRIASPDFMLMTTDTKSGRQTISPLIQLRDDQREQFQKNMEKLRKDAFARMLNKKNNGL